MKLGAVTKLDKRNIETSKKIVDDIMSAKCDVIVIFPIYGQFSAIQRPVSGRTVCERYIFINSSVLFYKDSHTI